MGQRNKILRLGIVIIFFFLNNLSLADDELNAFLKEEELDEMEVILAEGYEQSNLEAEEVKLTILDKISSKTTDVVYNIRARNYYGNFEIIVFNCRKPAVKNSNHAMLVGIWEKSGDKVNAVFMGWLFSKDSSVSQIEHRTMSIVNFQCR